MSILYLVPVVTSTISLWFAFDQYFFLGIFLYKDVEPFAKHVLTPYWNTMFRTSLRYIIAPVARTMISTTTILSTTSTELLQNKGSYSWYFASAFLAAGHFIFIPAVLPKIRSLSDGRLNAGSPAVDACAPHPRRHRGSLLLGRLYCCQYEDLVGLILDRGGVGAKDERKTRGRGFQAWE